MTEPEYEAALDRIAELMDAEPETSEYYELEKLTAQVVQYEHDAFPLSEVLDGKRKSER